jgi:fermentation-respiration switch protein FrsA (DUF1100 family)
MLCCAAAVLLACTSCGSGRATPNAPNYELATRVLHLHDPSRTTDPTPRDPGGPDARPGRDLPTTLWYPVTGSGPFPVVVFSHGVGAQPSGFADLLSRWASAGFVVAAPTFPLTSAESPRVIDDVGKQPGDVSFVLTQVLALDTTRNDPLEGRIDTRRIAAAGHSLGGATTLGLQFHCCQDRRVTATVVLAGTTLGTPTDFAAPGVPSLFVHGTDDELVPFSEGEAIYAVAPAPKAFLELPGGTHAEPYFDLSDPHHAAVRTVTTDFLRWALNHDDAALQRLRSEANQPGVATLTDDELPGG